MKSKITALVVGLVLGGTVAGTAGAGSAWQSDTFVSPSRNIHCQYAYEVIYCMTVNDHKQAALGPIIGATRSLPSARRPVATPFTPVLAYGATWSAPRLQCRSTRAYMACRSSDGHGFAISRDTLRIW